MASALDPAPLEPARRGLTGAIVPALAVAALAGLGAMLVVGRNTREAEAALPAGCALSNVEQFGGPITLRDVNGARVTEADFAGAPAVLYFGFTHCPDACPTALTALGAALASPEGRDIRSIFVTLDPERDTGEVLRTYASSESFPAGLTALTGASDEIKGAADAFGVAFRKGEPDASGAYSVDHSSLIYVLDGHWRTRAVMPTPHAAPRDMAACIKAALAGEN